LTPDGKIPTGVLQQGEKGIDQALAKFKEVKQKDAVHEAMPTADGKVPDINHKKKNSPKKAGPIFFRKDPNKVETPKVDGKETKKTYGIKVEK